MTNNLQVTAFSGHCNALSEARICLSDFHSRFLLPGAVSHRVLFLNTGIVVSSAICREAYSSRQINSTRLFLLFIDIYGRILAVRPDRTTLFVYTGRRSPLGCVRYVKRNVTDVTEPRMVSRRENTCAVHGVSNVCELRSVHYERWPRN